MYIRYVLAFNTRVAKVALYIFYKYAQKQQKEKYLQPTKVQA